MLHWAFRDELPKDPRYCEGYTGEGGSAGISPMFKYAKLGGPIDNWSREPGFPAAMGNEAHEDAIAVYNAVHRLDEVGILWPSAGEVLLGDELKRFVTPEEAFIIRGLKVQTVGLVMLHARMGNRPIWRVDYEIERVIGRERKAMIRKNRGRRHKALQGELRLTASPIEIITARLEWLVWHHALRTLAAELADQLEDHLPEPPVAPQAPWVDDTEGVILSDGWMDARALATGRLSTINRLPLVPQRPQTLPPLESEIERLSRLRQAPVTVIYSSAETAD